MKASKAGAECVATVTKLPLFSLRSTFSAWRSLLCLYLNDDARNTRHGVPRTTFECTTVVSKLLLLSLRSTCTESLWNIYSKIIENI